MRRWFPAIVVAASLVALATSGRCGMARDIFVSNVAGDDRRLGQDPQGTTPDNGPVHSIAKALRLAQPGDRIVLAATGQPYRESISITGNRLSGSQSTPFTIQGNGAILDGSAPVPGRAWQHYLGNTFRFRPARLGFQQLFIDDRPAEQRPVASPEGTVPELEPREWCLAGGYLYFCVDEGKLPQDYRLTHAALPVGITLHQVRGVTIDNLIVQGFQLDGINVHDGAFEVLLQGVTCRGNGRSGVSVGGSSRARIVDSLLGDNGAAQLRVDGYSHTAVESSQLIENTAPAVLQEGGELTVDGSPWSRTADK